MLAFMKKMCLLYKFLNLELSKETQLLISQRNELMSN